MRVEHGRGDVAAAEVFDQPIGLCRQLSASLRRELFTAVLRDGTFRTVIPHAAEAPDHLEHLYEEHFVHLASLPILAGVSTDKAAEVIDEILCASLYRTRPNLTQWLVAALTAAVDHMKEPE